MKKRIFAILFLIITSVFIIYNVTNYIEHKKKGLFLKFLTPIRTDWEKLEVQIIAITPDGEEEIFTGFLNRSELFLDATRGKFGNVVKAWLERFEIDFYKERFETCLILDVWIFLKNGTILSVEPCITIPFKPYDVSANLVVTKIELKLEQMRVINDIKSNSHFFSPNNQGIITEYKWCMVDAYSYITTKYVKIPFLIVRNPQNISAIIDWSFGVFAGAKTGFRLTVAYSDENITKKAPNVNLRIYVCDFTYSNLYNMFAASYVSPNELSYAFICAKIGNIYEREYIIQKTLDGTVLRMKPTGRERIREEVFDLKVYKVRNSYYPVCDWTKSETKFKDLMKWLYNGTMKEKLIIRGTALEDGKLDVQEMIFLEEILDYYDSYDVDFEIGIPVGAEIAWLMTKIDKKYETYAALISGLVVSLCHGDTAFDFVRGHLENGGGVKELNYTQNVSVYVFARISKYRYIATGSYTYKALVGVVFECIPEFSQDN